MSDRAFPTTGLYAALLAAVLLAACGQQQEPTPPAAPAASAPPAAQAADSDADKARPAPAGQPGAAATVTLTDADDGRAVALQRGQGVEMRLSADRSAGYTWIPVQNPLPVLGTDGAPLYDSQGEQAAGTEIWRFIALEPGHAHVVFEYRRPLEKGAPPQKSITFHFDVE